MINNCLNPVWDEELSFTLKDPAAVLSLVYFLLFIMFPFVVGHHGDDAEIVDVAGSV